MNQYENEDRRKSDRRVSPAVAEFALEERGELLARIAGLEAELEEALADWGTLRLELAALKSKQQSGECVAADELATFEEWASRKYPNASRRDALGAFSRDLKKSAKEGWQARSALASSKEGE